MNEANNRGVLNSAETDAKVAAMDGNNVRTELNPDLNRKLGIVRIVHKASPLSPTRIGRVDLIDRIVAHRRKGSISRIVRIGTIGVGMIVVEMDAQDVTRILGGISVQISGANSVRIRVVKAEGNHVPKPEGNFVRNRVRTSDLIRERSMTILLRKMSRVR